MFLTAEPLPGRELFDVIVAHIHVDGDPVEGGDFEIQDLNAHLPPVPPFLHPVSEDELVIPATEAKADRSVPWQASGAERSVILASVEPIFRWLSFRTSFATRIRN